MASSSYYQSGGGGGGYNQGGYPSRPSGYQDQPYNHNQQRPNPPEPWVAEWDSQQNTWVFINRQTGQRQHQFPQGGGYGDTRSGGYGGGYGSGYGGPLQQQPQQKTSHAGRNTALAAVGGLAAGALLMHEGHKVEEKWDEDKERFDYDKRRVEDSYDYERDRVENRFDYDRDRVEDRVRYDEDRIEDFPDDAARWTGRKVQEVEDIPEDVAGWTGRKVQEVEDIPDDIAGWAGRKVQGVEDFGDRIEDSYDAGRDEQEYRDDNRYDDDRW